VTRNILLWRNLKINNFIPNITVSSFGPLTVRHRGPGVSPEEGNKAGEGSGAQAL